VVSGLGLGVFAFPYISWSFGVLFVGFLGFCGYVRGMRYIYGDSPARAAASTYNGTYGWELAVVAGFFFFCSLGAGTPIPMGTPGVPWLGGGGGWWLADTPRTTPAAQNKN
jgi:hypothetical protein